MKHTGFRLGLLILLFINLLTGKAQTPLTEGGGPNVERCSAALSNTTLLKQDEKSAVFYLNTYSNNPKQLYQGLVTYNKSTNTCYNTDVVMPDGYRPLYVRPCGDSYFGAYYRLDRTKKSFEYATALFPQKKSTDGIRNVTPVSRLSFDISDREDIVKFAASSPDGSKFAVVIVAPDRYFRTSCIYYFIYDNAGNELRYDMIAPATGNNRFTVHDIAINHRSELNILLQTTKGKDNIIQLFRSTPDETTYITETVDFGSINSMKMLRLQNKEIFVGGYYNAGGKTAGFFNLVFNPDKNAFTHKNSAPFEFKGDPSYDGFTSADYLVKCDYLFELPDKIVMMLGEQYTTYQQHGEKSAMAYKHLANNIYGNKFTLTGNNLGVVKVQRHLTANSGSLLSQREEGERIGSSVLGEKTSAPKIPTLTNLGLSYAPIVKGNNVYVLFEDNAANYAEDATGWDAATIEKADENCVVLTKMDYSTDRKVVMIPSKASQTFHDIWGIDGDIIYFGMSGKKDYSIQKFKLDGKWSWDR